MLIKKLFLIVSISSASPPEPSSSSATSNVSVPDSKSASTVDQGLLAAEDSPHGLHYRSGDEPEPMDLTHLNIEAAMMCLASKVRALAGRSDSPTLGQRTFRFREVDRAARVASAVTKSVSHESSLKMLNEAPHNAPSTAVRSYIIPKMGVK